MGLALFFIKTSIYFGIFMTLVSAALAPRLSQFCPHVNQGFLSFSKQAFRTGSYRPHFSDRRLERQSWEDGTEADRTSDGA